jgi:hypothetical protein
MDIVLKKTRIQAKINSNPPIGVIGPRIFKLTPMRSLILKKYIENEKQIMPEMNRTIIVDDSLSL